MGRGDTVRRSIVVAGALLACATASAQSETFFPGNGEFGAVAFEDLFPCDGDHDFNDAVIAYRTLRRDDVSGDTTELFVNLDVRAMGASRCAGLALHLPVQRVAIASVQRRIGTPGTADGTPWNATETADTDPDAPFTVTADGDGTAVIWVTPDLRAELCGAAGFLNTEAASPVTECAPVMLRIALSTPTTVAAADPFDLFVHRCDDRTVQVHRTAYGGLSGGDHAADPALFGTCDDTTTPGTPPYYVDDRGIPFALNFGEGLGAQGDGLATWPRERVRIDQAMPRILEFADGSLDGDPGYDFYFTQVNAGLVFSLPQLAPEDGTWEQALCEDAGGTWATSCTCPIGGYAWDGATCHPAAITDLVVTSADGDVTLTWTPSAAPGFGQTLVVRKQGSAPTVPTDGVAVQDTDGSLVVPLTPWQTWYFALFPADATYSTFGEVTTATAFVHGDHLCPVHQLLVGVNATGDGVECAPATLAPTLDCTTVGASDPGDHTLTLGCSADRTVTGGGFLDHDMSYTTPSISDSELTSRPLTDTWRVRATTETGLIDAEARCCRATYGTTVAAVGDCPANQVVTGLSGVSGPADGLTCGAPFTATQTLDCTSVLSGDTNGDTPAIATCPGGYTITGGGFADLDWTTPTAEDDFDSYPVGNTWRVRFTNEGGLIVAGARCCRLRPASTAGTCPVGQAAIGIHSEQGSPFSLVCSGASVTPTLSCTHRQGTAVGAGQASLATCQGAEVVTGGGFEDFDRISGPEPNMSSDPEGNAWRALFDGEGGLFISHGLCCQAAGGAVLVP